MIYQNKKYYLIYLIGLFLILALPIVAISPWLFSPDWAKTIIFRSILSILLFLLVFQLVGVRPQRKGSDPNNEVLSNFQKLKKNKIFWLLIGLLAIFFLASIFSQDPYFSFWGSPMRAGGFVNFASYIIFALFIFLILKKSDWQKAWNFSIFIGILVALVAIFQVYGLFKNVLIPFSGRPPSTMGNSILLGIYLLLLFFIALSFAIKEKRRNYKLFYYFALLLFLFVILITGSRATYIGLAIGGLYFILAYPKKLPALKIITIVCLILGIFAVYYINSNAHFPQFLEKNKIFGAVRPRLSIKLALAEPRFSAWQVALKAIGEKPILGWGLENFAIGFDRYYNPSLPYISKDWGGWWDRAHNILLDIGVQSGIAAVIIYLALFCVLFWQMRRLKRKTENRETQIIGHGIQATLVAYLSANFFSFDGASSYIIFFFIVGYSLHLINLQQADETEKIVKNITQKNPLWKPALIFILFCLLIWFLWQCNIKPNQINTQLNMAEDLAETGNCGQAFNKLEKILPEHSFLDAYARLTYVETIKKCAKTNPEKDLEYAKKGKELLKDAVKIRPLYTRSWLFLGSFTNIEAAWEKDPAKKQDLLKEADSYFEKANQLSPNHQEIFVERAKMYLVAGDYQKMKEDLEKCVALDKSLGECYWYLSLSELYLNNFDNIKENMKMAYENGFNIFSVSSLIQLTTVYATTKNYKELALTYEKLIELRPNVPQYHSSLAFTYSKMGQYKKAREEAMMFLKLMPEAKDEVDLFLKTLPY